MSSKVRSHESSSDEDDESHKRNKTDESEQLKSKKTAPNILISGTPGVGKSTLCSLVQEKYSQGGGQIEVVNIGQLAKEKGFLGEFDDARECPEIDEDAIIDDLEPKMSGQVWSLAQLYYVCFFTFTPHSVLEQTGGTRPCVSPPLFVYSV